MPILEAGAQALEGTPIACSACGTQRALGASLLSISTLLHLAVCFAAARVGYLAQRLLLYEMNASRRTDTRGAKLAEVTLQHHPHSQT